MTLTIYQGRNKFKEKPETGVRFSGSGFLALDRSDYVEMEEELAVRLRFKPESADGALLVAGDETEGDFVALEMRARRLVYRYRREGRVRVGGWVSSLWAFFLLFPTGRSMKGLSHNERRINCFLL